MKRSRFTLVYILAFAGMALLFAAAAWAGIMQEIGSAVKTVAGSGSLWAGLAALVLVYIFKAIPNQKIYDFFYAFFDKLGSLITNTFTKWKWTAPLWNKYIEPWVIDLYKNTVVASANGLEHGLRSDNEGD